MSAILYLFHTLPQAKYLFHFLQLKNSVYKFGSQTGLSLSIDTGFNHLMMPREARQTFFQGPLNIYLQHVHYLSLFISWKFRLQSQLKLFKKYFSPSPCKL